MALHPYAYLARERRLAHDDAECIGPEYESLVARRARVAGEIEADVEAHADGRTPLQIAWDQKQERHFADHPPPVSAESRRVAGEAFARMTRGSGMCGRSGGA